jgi:pyrroline-5-carboxylate reductase
MEKFAMDQGISRETARLLACQTVMGAGKMMKETGGSFEQMRKNVTSPGGTTQAAMKYLENNSLARIFYDALTKAKQRSQELSGR